MPELPEVETVRRGLQPAMEGARFDEVHAHRGDLRWPLPKDLAARLKGQTVTGLGRRAKYLLADTSTGDVLLMHLGMSGSFRVIRDGKEVKAGSYYHERSNYGLHDHVVFRMSSGATIAFNDPRRFGCMKLFRRDAIDDEPLLRALGPEPLSPEFCATHLHARTRGRRASIKETLMNSHMVVGVGNIYASEALFRAGVHPRTPAGRLSLPRCARLVESVRFTLQAAIDAGGSSLRDWFQADGASGYFQQAYFVYGRAHEPCRQCSAPIREIRQGQRATFYCPRCQR